MGAIRGRELTGAVVKKVSIVTRPANRAPFRIMKADFYWNDPKWIQKRDFTAKKRKQLANSGHAMPDGSFPIQNEEDLHNAVRLAGNAKDPEAAKAHIRSRAAAMGAKGAIPSTWGSSKKAEANMSIFDRLGKIMKLDRPPAKSEVTAVAFANSVSKEDAEKALNFIFPAGTKLELRKSNDVNLYVIEGAVEGPDDLVLKLDADVSVVMSNAKKGLFGDGQIPGTFADKVVDNCVFPGLSMALEHMATTLWGGVMSAANPADAVAKIDEVTSDAASYMKTLVSAIPVAAYKAEFAVVKKSGGKMTLAFSGVNDDQGKFPMEPSGKDKNSGASRGMGPDGGSQGVDPDKGSDVDGDGDDKNASGTEGDGGGSDADGRLPGQKRTQGMKREARKATSGGSNEGDDDMKDCPTCDGEGENEDGEDCSTCDGKGKVPANFKKKGQGDGGTDGYTTADNGSRSSNDGVIAGEDGKGGGNRRTTAKGDGDPVLAAISSLADTVKKAVGRIDTIGTEVGEISIRVVKTEEGMKRMRATLKSTVNAEADGEIDIQKSDDSEKQFGLIDTGMDRSWLNDDDKSTTRNSRRDN